MTSDFPASSSSQQPFANSKPAPVSNSSQATSPPTKQSLKNWWKAWRPPAKGQESNGKTPLLISSLSKIRKAQFKEHIMNDASPAIDGIPDKKKPGQEHKRVPISSRSYASQGRSQSLPRSKSTRESSSILRTSTNQLQNHRKSSSVMFDAKQRFSYWENRSVHQDIFITDFDSDPLGAGTQSDYKRTSLSQFFAGLPFNQFRSRKLSKTLPQNILEDKAKQENEAVEHPTGIFGVPLRQSIAYANVAISLVDGEGKSYIYGYVPIVVAKCGVYLKEKATNVEGIFRLSGSEKRIKELRAIFDSPDRYGKGLDWAGYTVHDAANVLRRYLNQLPEPIVPLELYDRFREPLRGHTKQAVGDNEGPQLEDDFDVNAAIVTYQHLITELPPLNRQLLLYILDLLAVFASKSDENRMNSQNLAAIFQPGMLSHPQHDMAPLEYRLSQDVLIFLIENQDHFLIGMRGTAADEKTVQEVQSGGTPPPGTPSTPGRSKNTVGRTASNASAGAESVRKFGGVRRNVSVSSRHSKQSNGAPSPATPTYGGSLSVGNGGGVHRSNTVPSKKSPGLPQGRLQKNSGSPSPIAAGISSRSPVPRGQSPSAVASKRDVSPSSPGVPPSAIGVSSLAPSSIAASAVTSQERLLGEGLEKYTEVVTPSKERSVSSFFRGSPAGEGDKKAPNKLRKKRIPSSNPSAQSSTNSLHGPQSSSASPGLRAARDMQDTVDEHPQLESIQSANPVLSNTDATPPATETPRAELNKDLSSRPEEPHHSSEQTLKPNHSPVSSLHSKSSFNDHSDLEHVDDPTTTAEQKEKRSRWRLSRRKDDSHGTTLSPQKPSGSDSGAGASSSSLGSSARPRKSFTADTVPVGSESTLVGTHLQSSNDSGSGGTGEEKKGPLGWIKNKMRDRREEKEAGKERTKSPPASTERLATRGKSMDVMREENPERIAEEPPLPQPEPTQR